MFRESQRKDGEKYFLGEKSGKIIDEAISKK